MRVLWFPLVSFLLAILLGSVLVPLLRGRRLSQSIREEGPAGHRRKEGTPTMGGVLFVLPAAALYLLIGRGHPRGLAVLGLLLGFALLGFLDDLTKVRRRRSLGLKARSKLAYGVVLASIFSYLVAVPLRVGTAVLVPLTHRYWELGYLYYPFAVLVVLSTVNAVNLTDGLDGLAAGSSALVLGFFAAVAFRQGDLGLAMFALSLAGATIGFLFYNLHPARIFMGDTGSLALGAALAGLALVTATPLFLLLVGGVFVLETLSVILQVLSFRLMGRRLFRMSPLHHHFELLGWPEELVVTVFWLGSLVLVIMGWFVLRT